MSKRAQHRSSLPGNPEPSPAGATPAGTAGYSGRFADQFRADFFRRTSFGPTVSSIGLGTYLGATTADDDARYVESVEAALGAGINLIDSAINYRGQRSERAVCAALQRLLLDGIVSREEIVVCSKGGYIPLEPDPPATREAYAAYVEREFLLPEVLRREEIVSGGHSLAPRFLRYCLAKSRQNLGLRSIDVYYVHNPGQQLGAVDRATVYQRLRDAFAVLEEAAERGHIGVYGIATWNELRVPPDAGEHLGLEAIVELARELAGDRHHCRAVQLPINLAMPEGIAAATQPVGGRLLPAAEAATELGLTTFASATLLQARLATGLPTELHARFPGCTTDAQRAVAFTRGAPGVTAALVGMKQPAHLADTLGACATLPPSS